jgi:hypothetical protein
MKTMNTKFKHTANFPFAVEITTPLTINLPVMIDVDDYHEFRMIQHYYNMIGLDVEVTEVGFENGNYVGIVHLDIDSHCAIVEQAREYFKELEQRQFD